MSDTTVNWTLLNSLAARPHRHDGAPHRGYRRVVQHLLDVAGVPDGVGVDTRVDARVYLLLVEVLKLRETLGRLRDRHSRETGPAGTVGVYCTECDARWPCSTRRLVDGTYVEDDGTYVEDDTPEVDTR